MGAFPPGLRRQKVPAHLIQPGSIVSANPRKSSVEKIRAASKELMINNQTYYDKVIIASRVTEMGFYGNA